MWSILFCSTKRQRDSVSGSRHQNTVGGQQVEGHHYLKSIRDRCRRRWRGLRCSAPKFWCLENDERKECRTLNATGCMVPPDGFW